MIFLQLYIGNEWDTTNICWNFYAVELMDTYVVFKEYAPNGAWLALPVLYRVTKSTALTGPALQNAFAYFEFLRLT